MLCYYAKSLRTYLNLSPKQLAKLANVYAKSVELMESGAPVQLGDKRKIMAALYMRKANNYA